MCTLTAVPHEEGFRLGCNRDERLSRPEALPPRLQHAGTLLAAFPEDMTGGGTWIGVNERGLVAAILNRTVAGDRAAASGFRCSRGTIVRHLLGAEDLDHALRRITALPLRAFNPFTLVAAHRGDLAVVTNDGRAYGVTVQSLDRPACFSSSSLGDALVIEPRLELFERTVARAVNPLLMQPGFHRHQWPDRPHLSVSMRREDAATLSCTWIDVTNRRAEVRYEPREGVMATLDLPLVGTPEATRRVRLSGVREVSRN